MLSYSFFFTGAGVITNTPAKTSFDMEYPFPAWREKRYSIYIKTLYSGVVNSSSYSKAILVDVVYQHLLVVDKHINHNLDYIE